MLTASKEFEEKKKQFLPQLELVKTLPYSSDLMEMANIARKALKIARIYLDERLALLQEQEKQATEL